MNYIIFTAFGREIKRFTCLNINECIEILEQICPTYNNFTFSPKEENKLNSILTCTTFPIKRKRRNQIYFKRINKFVQKEKNNNLSKILFFEDELLVLTKHNSIIKSILLNNLKLKSRYF